MNSKNFGEMDFFIVVVGLFVVLLYNDDFCVVGLHNVFDTFFLAGVVFVFELLLLHICFTCCRSVHYMHAIPQEASRGHWIPPELK